MKTDIRSIQVFGSNCPTCKKLYELAKEAASQLDITTEVEYSSDIQKLLDTGMMSSPVLVINGRPVWAGNLPSIEKLKELLSVNGQPSVEESHRGCSCGGRC